ncbi:hypothetical protein AOC36_03255 [Erysipelothrix larvae]|uniref:Cysteine ABC transporter ATP-binding protein n=1 Tax=Erysipelothrix larvae TaxID=1514105 RepID=A0A109UGS1_9FIRM|nr:ABC transporter ATP-binding protein/permease [Erysipelothrix larvae]AMC93033.1 hypothetical protein AOC36_03255 [Erysipelothrix larvae]
MINWKLVGLVNTSKRRIKRIVLLSSGALLMQGLFLLIIKTWIDQGLAINQDFMFLCAGALLLIILKNGFNLFRFRQSTALSSEAKSTLRGLLFEKISRIEPSQMKTMNHAELGQLMSEGIDHCELYFGSYVPQFFYAFIAPVLLSIMVSFFSVNVAIWLCVCVPLIPIAIMAVQKIAKRLLEKYWGSYTTMSDNFLDRLKGLKTLKIFDVDDRMQDQIDADAEHFRKATMRVLIMQLNSISIMDWVAYGGACGAIIIALTQYNRGDLTLSALIFIALVSAEFFIPMRQLGSFFHVAMNGAQAARRIFSILDLEDMKRDVALTQLSKGYHLDDVTVHYGSKNALNHVSLDFTLNQTIGLVGESGSGKSTLVSLLSGFKSDYDGTILIDDMDIRSINLTDLYNHVGYVGSDSTVFQGSFRSNLQMNDSFSDELMMKSLQEVGLDHFVLSKGGLDFVLETGGDELSVGQKQRLCLARCLLRKKAVYIFDEVASGVDLESEMIILDAIHTLKAPNTLIIIVSHRLKSIEACDGIVVMDQGQCVGYGIHEYLMKSCPTYKNLVSTQRKQELFFEKGNDA